MCCVTMQCREAGVNWTTWWPARLHQPIGTWQSNTECSVLGFQAPSTGPEREYKKDDKRDTVSTRLSHQIPMFSLYAELRMGGERHRSLDSARAASHDGGGSAPYRQPQPPIRRPGCLGR